MRIWSPTYSEGHICPEQACKLQFRLRELPSCLCSATALAVCFKGGVAGLDAKETGNKLYQPKFEFTSLVLRDCLKSELAD